MTSGPPAEAAGRIGIADRMVARMGFGALRITGPLSWGDPVDAAASRRILRHAVDLGVTLIDTADSYGPEVSERLIHDALYPYPSDLLIATKGGKVRPSADDWVVDGRPEHLKVAIDGSLRRLGVDSIDLYQLHEPDPRVPLEESLEALLEAQQQGKLRRIGLSNVSVAQLETALRMTDVASVQNRYNLADRRSRSVLQACEQRAIPFLAWQPLATDALAPDASVKSVAAELRATPQQVMLAWLLAHSPVMLVIPGTSSIDHLRENVDAAGLRLGPEQLARLDALARA
jgi:pyridoxine 4-dehydrogenase